MLVQEKQKRLKKRKQIKKARENLLDFIKYLNPDYIVNWHHEAICDRLTKLKDQQGKKIMIFVGPQRGKSEIVSRNFPAWWLGHFPGSKNILASYSSSLANSFNIDCQNIMSDDRYHEIFPETITGHLSGFSHLKTTQNQFITSKQGYLYSVGVGGTTTGKSAGTMGSKQKDSDIQKGTFIVDDPIKDLPDAFSEANKKTRYQWWQAVVNTRVHKTSHQILMHTRWATDDLAGTLINEGAIDKGWEILSFPEIGPDRDFKNKYDKRKNNEVLWEEEKGGYDELMKLKEEVGSYVWQALFGQKPKIQGGNIVKEEWINKYTRLPFDPLSLKSTDIIQSWDLTFKETKKGSYVVGVTLARFESSFYLIDIYRKRADIIETQRAIKSMSDCWPNCRTILIEEKANGSAILSLLKKQVTGMIAVKPDTSKDERLMVVAPIFEAGNFFIDANNVYTKDVIDELTSFPSCPHDDIVDAISQGLNRFGKLKGLARLKASVR